MPLCRTISWSCYNSEGKHWQSPADKASVDTNAATQSQKAGQPTFLLMIKNSTRLKEKEKLSKIARARRNREKLVNIERKIEQD